MRFYENAHREQTRFRPGFDGSCIDSPPWRSSTTVTERPQDAAHVITKSVATRGTLASIATSGARLVRSTMRTMERSAVFLVGGCVVHVALAACTGTADAADEPTVVVDACTMITRGETTALAVEHTFPGRSAADLARTTALLKFDPTADDGFKPMGYPSYVAPLLVKDGAVPVRCLPSSGGTAVVSVTLIVPPAL